MKAYASRLATATCPPDSLYDKMVSEIDCMGRKEGCANLAVTVQDCEMAWDLYLDSYNAAEEAAQRVSGASTSSEGGEGALAVADPPVAGNAARAPENPAAATCSADSQHLITPVNWDLVSAEGGAAVPGPYKSAQCEWPTTTLREQHSGSWAVATRCWWAPTPQCSSAPALLRARRLPWACW